MVRRENTLFMVFQNRKLRTIILAFCWCAGLLTGCYFANCAGNIHYSMMRRATSCSVSIAGLVVVLLPFLFSAFAVYWNRPSLMYIVCFLKAWSFTLAAYGILNAFGSAGWLVRFLVQFSDILLLCPLCWFFLRHIRGNSAQWKRDLWICSAAAAAVCSIDYCVVSRFLVMLTQI